MSEPFVAVEGQCFTSHQEWVNKATSWLTSHPHYNNTEHGEKKGWRGAHFTALCFDQKGRRVRNGGDFQRAHEEEAFPIWWIWPDQIAELLMASADVRSALREMADYYGHGLANSEFPTEAANMRAAIAALEPKP